jgi:PAS domain S-box-containing protein
MSGFDLHNYCRRILEIMQEGLIIVSPHGEIMAVNKALEKMTGYSRQELEGRICTVFDCDACNTLRKQAEAGTWCQLFEKREFLQRKCHIVRKDGSYLTVLKAATVLEDEQGKPMGAIELLTEISELDRLDTEVQQLSRLLDQDTVFHGLVGHSKQMKDTFQLIERAAQTDFPVFIYGESGTGKDLVARALHKLSPRSDKPYVQVNCAALNEALLESELFGHVKGAFTGAFKHRQGRFEIAHGGDIFLDEIGDLPLSVQVKLLRVLENKIFERVGDNRPISVDLRFITATNKDLQELISRGDFREDLFYRINVIPIQLPALRERTEDIPPLVEFFLHRLNHSRQGKIKGLSPEARRLIMHYSWPGNVRELKSTLEYAFVLAGSEVIEPEHLPAALHRGPEDCGQAGDPRLEPAAREQKQELLQALKASRGNKSEAARSLGINRVTVLNRMRKYGIRERDILE